MSKDLTWGFCNGCPYLAVDGGRIASWSRNAAFYRSCRYNQRRRSWQGNFPTSGNQHNAIEYYGVVPYRAIAKSPFYNTMEHSIVVYIHGILGWFPDEAESHASISVLMAITHWLPLHTPTSTYATLQRKSE
jgi:hypothetical protein